MAIVSPYLSVTTLYVNGLNSSVKSHRVVERIKKQNPTVYCLQKTHFRFKDIQRLKVKGWTKKFHANTNQKPQRWLYIRQNRF